MIREVDISIISDVHLGTYGCHARELLNYLKSIKPRTLILNGDFIDMWQFRKGYFPGEHFQVIRQVLKMANKGTKVYYITGNHDDPLRKYADFSTGNIHLRNKLVIQLAGKSYWIFHGDIFDLSIQYSPFISKLVGKSYDLLIKANRVVNKIRVKFGKQPMSFAGFVKHRVKEAVKFISDFENIAIEHASEQNYDYVICGHIHKPQIRSIKTGNHSITYMNSGDWIENLSALEYKNGKWAIYQYDDTDFDYVNPKLRIRESSNEDMKISREIILEHIIGTREVSNY